MPDMGRCVAAKATVTTSLLLYLLMYRGSALRDFPCNNGRAAANAQQSGARSRVVQRWSSPTSQRASSRSELDQNSTPLVDALVETANKVRSPLFYPGHKMGSGAPSRFVERIIGGKLDALRHDLPELDELDNLFAPEGAIRDAEILTAEAFGAAKTWLLANGSTSGVIASILACVQRHNSTHQQPAGRSSPQAKGGVNNDSGERAAPPLQRRSVVILPRDAHKSAVHALVLSGATPCFLPPLRHPRLGMGLGIERAALEAALRDHGDEVAAVLLVSPTYEGVCLDVESAAKSCHAAGVPLVVDEAHGAHLAFLGMDDDDRSDVPKAALQCGADLVVQSAHKTLGSLTQSAFLHLGNGALLAQKETVSAALAMVQSSSPSYLLLASLDAARWSLAGGTKEGKRRLEEAVRIARTAREELSRVEGINVVDLEEEVGRNAGFVGTDPLRLTVSFDGGFGGYDADDMLMEEFGVYSELPTLEYITFVFGPGSTVEHGRTLTEALRKVARKAKSQHGGKSKSSDIPFARPVPAARQLCTPREAYFRPSRSIAAGDAVGLASAETVCPYPPGIPALLPGEAITQEALDLLMTVKDAGGFISGCTDPSLSTIRVVQDTSTP